MSKLIVDDAGKQRAFRLGEGRLTVGSGEQDKLRLEAAGVVPGHLSLIVRGESISIDATAAVELGGEQLEGEHRWHGGQTLVVGEARLSFVSEGGGPKAPAGAKAPRRPSTTARTEGQAAGGRRSTAGSSGRARTPRAEGDAPRRRAGAASRARSQGGLPSWALPLGVVVLLGGTLGWWALKGGGTPLAGAVLEQAAAQAQDGQLETARNVISKIDRSKLSTELRTRYDEVQHLIDASKEGQSASQRRNDALAWSQIPLQRFRTKYLDNENVTSGQVRMWFENLEKFRSENPDLNTPTWTENIAGEKLVEFLAETEAKFRDHPGRTGPPNLADAEWWIEYYTSGGSDGTKDKLYAPAFAKLDEVAAVASAEDKLVVDELRSQLLADRTLYVEQRMARSKEFYERYLESNALSELQISAAALVDLIHQNRDAGIRNTAASVLIQFPLDKLRAQILPSYAEYEPIKYASLLEVPQIENLVQLGSDQAP